MTINQIIEDERLSLNRDLQRHLARGNWQKAADTVVKDEYLERLKKRVQDESLVPPPAQSPTPLSGPV
jgi:DnaJ-domain-containing protein 1